MSFILFLILLRPILIVLCSCTVQLTFLFQISQWTMKLCSQIPCKLNVIWPIKFFLKSLSSKEGQMPMTRPWLTEVKGYPMIHFQMTKAYPKAHLHISFIRVQILSACFPDLSTTLAKEICVLASSKEVVDIHIQCFLTRDSISTLTFAVLQQWVCSLTHFVYLRQCLNSMKNSHFGSQVFPQITCPASHLKAASFHAWLSTFKISVMIYV